MMALFFVQFIQVDTYIIGQYVEMREICQNLLQ